jgi:hypothetical protein
MVTTINESNMSCKKAITVFISGPNISIPGICGRYFWVKEIVAKSKEVVDQRA